MSTTINQPLLKSALNYFTHLRASTPHPRVIFRYLSLINIDISALIMLLAFFPHPHFLSIIYRVAFTIFAILTAIFMDIAFPHKTDSRLALNSNMTRSEKETISDLFYLASRMQKRGQARRIISNNFTYSSCVNKLLKLLQIDIMNYQSTLPN